MDIKIREIISDDYAEVVFYGMMYLKFVMLMMQTSE